MVFMIRHPLYDEFEKEDYAFAKVLINGQLTPKVINNKNLNDFCYLNTTMVVNGQYQIIKSSQCSEKSVEMLKKFFSELSKKDFIDYDFSLES